jgi:aerobic-type carbon monoxide dehydrogenase small subunit (CoxS/CutS family)
MSADVLVTLTVNGREVSKAAGGHLSLLRWLRDVAGVTDPKYGCGEGICGACTVLLDGQPVSACLVLAAQVDGATVTTAAALAGGQHHSRREIREELHGNLCRCTGYGPIVDAIEMAQQEAGR